MLFNSIDFAIFLPIVFLLYWFVFNRNLKLQNLFVVVASYIFYGWWDARFLWLILFSTLTDYIIGLCLLNEERERKRKIFLLISVVVNIGFLGFFKYFNFFVDSFVSAFSFFGMPVEARTLNIILPVGISFYTFQTMSYTIDVYRRKFEATKDFVAFSAFISFFPLLVAGPIERASNFLPQFYTKRTFDYSKAVDGLRQILWGLFKKMVIADNCAVVVNTIFNNSDGYSGSTLVIGVIFFAFQVYGDFSGYSDIAIGASRLLGFNAMKNFAFPFFSRDIAEFWRRWHISLTTWFRDYIYIPLGGSRDGTLMKIRNVVILYLVSGFWHGANWTFLVWGAFHAILFIPSMLSQNNRKHIEIVAYDRSLPTIKECFQMAKTFLLLSFSFIIFRAEDLGHAWRYTSGMFTSSLFTVPDFPNIYLAAKTACLIVVFMAIEWIGRRNEYAIEKLGIYKNPILKWVFYYGIAFITLYFGGEEQQFIYFQF